jgi:glycosyltransferase involved in cell wall biosynthesis
MVLAQSSIFVLPSRFEGFPNALLEAMAMGAAVVSTDCDHGPREIITHDEDGLLVPVDDVDALATAIGGLIAHEQRRGRIAAQAQRVRTRFSGEVVMERWSALIDTCVGRRTERGEG